MTIASSPVHYPATSSPREEASPRKRRRIDHEERGPLQPITANRIESPAKIGGFIDEDDSDGENLLSQLCRDKSGPGYNGPLPNIDAKDKTRERQYGMHDEMHDSGCELVSSPQQSSSPLQPTEETNSVPRRTLHTARTASGCSMPILQKLRVDTIHYSSIVAARSTTAPGRAQKSYYGIDVHALVDQSKTLLDAATEPATLVEETVVPSVEYDTRAQLRARTHLWTEKYRPRKFIDLIGDERTHRSVLRWLKAWDPIVFPSQAPSRPKARSTFNKPDSDATERQHRKVLLLTGPPGLGKTTLAHVCAHQAGYETQEINASDERTKDVVKGRIRDMVGTENVRTVDASSGDGSKKKAARPVCVIVDEVDGVVSGSNAGGGGDSGFIKALLDLLATDHRNASYRPDVTSKGERRGDNFRMLRPLILICNDVYHPSLRLLRHGPHAEVIHVRKPALTMVVPRLCAIFQKEGVPADSDGVRMLCEGAWGITSKAKGGKGAAGGGQTEGDIRGILVAGEWVAGKLRAAASAGVESTIRLTRRWIETNVLSEMVHGGAMAKSLGRGGTRDVVDRVFKHNAGFPLSVEDTGNKPIQDDAYAKDSAIGAAEAVKRNAMGKLREMIESSGEEEKILLDCFTSYPTHPYQDTTTLSKPDTASDWLHFQSQCSYRLHHNQEWDLAPYLSYPVLAFHHLFASANHGPPTNPNSNTISALESEKHAHPLTTPQAPSHAFEASRSNTAALTHLHTQLSLPLQRSFRSHPAMATELIPYALRILNPAVKPVLVGGTASVRRGEERDRISRSVDAMRAVGVKFEKGRVDLREDGEVGGMHTGESGSVGRDSGGWVYRMEPPLDELGSFGTTEGKNGAWEGDAGKARFALRQVLAQGYEGECKRAEAEARARRSGGVVAGTSAARGDDNAGEKEKALEGAKKKAARAVKRDFFGRVIVAATASGDAVAAGASEAEKGKGDDDEKKGNGKPRVWATFNEGYSNAVRKPITMRELMEGL